MSDPILPIIKTEGDTPYLAGSRCGACGQIFVGERDVCAKCTARGQMAPIKLAETGALYAYTVVERSFPGVAVPFIDAVVDLDDGSHLKGTLMGVDPDPATIPFGLKVKIAWREAVPVGADKPYLTYVFVPQEGASA
ncbi:MAG TPA: OB-fold domain-containing protein [Chakrabartia sp.]|jgi:hypothetical protein|nr:OB-fold domain-containing protein [Chakrabartia sp.]